MVAVDLLGAALTALALLSLGASGYLIARKVLGAGAADPLQLAVATLLAVIFEAELVALVLGKLGLLRIELALVPPLLVTAALWLDSRRRGEDAAAAVRLLLRRIWARAVEHPAMSLIAVHALAIEALRGLLRPPLSWDSVMYHLPIAATWLQEGRVAPVFGAWPMSLYGLQPAGGELWLWWWLAPSHSELYANLCGFVPAALLALATGGVARELGAARYWPLAGFLTLLAPVVLRFASTQYVDTLVGGAIVAAALFISRWLAQPRLGTALLAGAGLGMAASVKVFGLAYALALAGVALLFARGNWTVRARHALAAAAVATFPGTIFYVQSWLAGAGPLASACARDLVRLGMRFPNPLGAAMLLPELVRSGRLLDVFLGTSRAGSLELGIGPQALLLVPVLALPWLLPAASRTTATLVWSQVAAQLAVWLAVPFANGEQFLANLRYLDGALALGFAGVVALGERWGIALRWATGIVLALLVQDLLMVHAEMPRGVRVGVALVDVVAVALALSPRLRVVTWRHARWIAAGIVVAALAAAPFLARFRVRDRARAFRDDTTLHATPLRSFAGAWSWLDRHGRDGTVAVVAAPSTPFSYPAMGLRLRRRALYVNTSRADHRRAASYPGCDPRAELDSGAWIANLRRAGVRWIHVSHFAGSGFPPELAWAEARPDLFAVRYRDIANVVLELRSPGGTPWQDRSSMPARNGRSGG